jgi:hypothetical protein
VESQIGASKAEPSDTMTTKISGIGNQWDMKIPKNLALAMEISGTWKSTKIELWPNLTARQQKNRTPAHTPMNREQIMCKSRTQILKSGGGK